MTMMEKMEVFIYLSKNSTRSMVGNLTDVMEKIW